MSSIAFSFGFKDLIDILLVAVILYETYRLLRNTGAANLFWGILLFILMRSKRAPVSSSWKT